MQAGESLKGFPVHDVQRFGDPAYRCGGQRRGENEGGSLVPDEFGHLRLGGNETADGAQDFWRKVPT